MSVSQGRLADHILAHPMQSATMGIEELASHSGVSIATVNRFVRFLGLSGFAEFRSRLVEAFRRTVAPIEKLRGLEQQPNDPSSIFACGLRMAAADLTESESLLGAESCEIAARLVLESRMVVIVGLGISAITAQLTAELIEPFCQRQIVLNGWGGQERMARRAMQVREGDLAIIITIPRYSRATVDSARSLREAGARILGITDAPTSPIVPYCDAVLFSGARHPVLHASSVGVVAMAENLAAVLMRSRPGIADAVELTERIYPYLFDEDAESGHARTAKGAQ